MKTNSEPCKVRIDFTQYPSELDAVIDYLKSHEDLGYVVFYNKDCRYPTAIINSRDSSLWEIESPLVDYGKLIVQERDGVEFIEDNSFGSYSMKYHDKYYYCSIF